MDELKNYDPTAFLDEFRGKYFEGEWPTLPQMFDITVARYPKRPCFTDWDTDDGSKRTYTYEQSHKMILALANWMCFAGVKPGDRIAVSGKNSPEWAVVYLAALYAGAIVCPLDYALHNEELDNLLATAQPVMFFVDEEKYSYFYKRNNRYTKGRYAQPQKSCKRLLYCPDPHENLFNRRILCTSSNPPRLYNACSIYRSNFCRCRSCIR